MYPFSAVVGLDDLRLALVVNAVSPAVGGVLVRGEKGTAGSLGHAEGLPDRDSRDLSLHRQPTRPRHLLHPRSCRGLYQADRQPGVAGTGLRGPDGVRACPVDLRGWVV